MLNNLQSNHIYPSPHSFKSSEVNQNLSDSRLMTVFEHQVLFACDFIYQHDFDWLVAQELSVFSLKRQRGQWQLNVGHYIGIIILPSGLMLEILPKAIAGKGNHLSKLHRLAQTRQWVQRMLTELVYGNNHRLPKVKNLGQTSQHLAPLSRQTPSLSEWLINQFMQRLAIYQPTQQYQTCSQNQSMLQGKLLLKEQLRRNIMQPHKFVSEVSTLSQDMLSNRLIKSALLLLEPNHPSLRLTWRQVSALNQHELQQLDKLYAAAQRQLSLQPLMGQQLQAAQQLLELAYWLLQAQHSALPSGTVLQASNEHRVSPMRLCLLIEMQKAFEQWVSRRIAATFNEVSDKPLSYRYQPSFQPRDVWLRDPTGQSCLSIQPDLLIYRNATNTKNDTTSEHRCSHVIDIKWKHLSQPSDISASDAYQLTSYAQAYQAEQIWLVYPVIGDDHLPIALHQQFPEQVSSAHLQQGTLWLMPFNVLTGMINSNPIDR